MTLQSLSKNLKIKTRRVVMQPKTILISTEEGRALFFIAIELDKSLRKLAIYALRHQYDSGRYKYLLNLVTDAISVYRLFLDALFSRFSEESTKNTGKSFSTSKPQFYKKILSDFNKYGRPFQLRSNRKEIHEFLPLIKSTDTIVKIIENFAQNNFDQASSIRTEINEQILLLKLAEKNCRAELSGFNKSRKIQKYTGNNL